MAEEGPSALQMPPLPSPHIVPTALPAPPEQHPAPPVQQV